MIGKAKMISYENIEDARTKRTAKEEAIAGKGKRGRKRKSPSPEAEKAKKARRSEVELAENEIAIAGMGNHCSVLQLQYATVQ